MPFFSKNNRAIRRTLFVLSGLMICILAGGCRSVYKSYEPVSVTRNCLELLNPGFNNDLYKAQIDISGKSLSGLLLIKKMPDSSTRIVFSTETGVKFFDFAFMENGEFNVIDILKRLDKKVVITALRKDFEVLLIQNTGKIPERVLLNREYLYHGYAKGKKQAWYLTDVFCQQLVGAELSSKRKPLVRMNYFYQKVGSPDSIYIKHLNFSFNIALKKIER